MEGKMFFDYYFSFFGLILLCAVFSGWASNKVKRTYRAFNSVPLRSNMTGYDTAVRLLRSNGVRDISIGRVKVCFPTITTPKRKS
mgnify:CR=1 FL=1